MSAYSAAFGWLFSEQSALSLDQRLKVLEKLIGKNTPNACSIDADTEWQSVDLLLIIKAESTNPLRVIAFENKIKASEGERRARDEAAELRGQLKASDDEGKK